MIPVRTFAVDVTDGNVYIDLLGQHGDRERVPPNRLDVTTAASSNDWNETLDAYDRVLADSFPASDPPPGPLAI